MLTRLVLVYICNLIDTVATVNLFLTQEGEELNPISAWLLQSPPLFVIVKMVVMTAAVAFLWWKRDWKPYVVLSWILFVEYTLVAFYYVVVYLFLL